MFINGYFNADCVNTIQHKLMYPLVRDDKNFSPFALNPIKTISTYRIPIYTSIIRKVI